MIYLILFIFFSHPAHTPKLNTSINTSIRINSRFTAGNRSSDRGPESKYFYFNNNPTFRHEKQTNKKLFHSQLKKIAAT